MQGMGLGNDWDVISWRHSKFVLEITQPLLVRQESTDGGGTTFGTNSFEKRWVFAKSLLFHSRRSRERDLNIAFFQVILM
jgi:hypothetical protein